MGALVIAGVGLRTGVLPSPAPLALTVVPAAFGAAAIVLALAMALIPAELPGSFGRGVARSAAGCAGR